MRRHLIGLLTFLLPVVVIAVVIHDHASPEATTPTPALDEAASPTPASDEAGTTTRMIT